MADRPQHILEIPESLGRDVDRWKAGKGEAPPMEAFMSDAAVEQAERATSAAAVHAGDLVPISKAEAARRTTFDGEHLPSLPATRRVIPVPFARQRIAVEHHGRAWAWCRADRLEPGDTVPGVGRLTEVIRETRYGEAAGTRVVMGMSIYLKGAGGVERLLDPGDYVQAFILAQ